MFDAGRKISLPVELIEQILCYLDAPDILACQQVRLPSRSLQVFQRVLTCITDLSYVLRLGTVLSPRAVQYQKIYCSSTRRVWKDKHHRRTSRGTSFLAFRVAHGQMDNDTCRQLEQYRQQLYPLLFGYPILLYEGWKGHGIYPDSVTVASHQGQDLDGQRPHLRLRFAGHASAHIL